MIYVRERIVLIVRTILFWSQEIMMSNDKFDIQEELKKLPNKPGVYIMHDKEDAIIYVGKVAE